MIASSSRNHSAPVSIISGRFRGRKLVTPGAGTHPMGAREKNALFNMVADVFADSAAPRVADLYAGSGALGFEAASRGADTVVLVERAPEAARVIRQNLATLGSDLPAASLFVEPVAKFLARPEQQHNFDLVLADPPYSLVDPAELARLGDLLAPDGILALSTPAAAPPLALPDLVLATSRTYAGARLSLYRAA